MSIQYEDGSFSELLTFEEMVERCKRESEEGLSIRAMHLVGSQEELDKRKAKIRIEDRVEELENQMRKLSPVIIPLIPISKGEFERIPIETVDLSKLNLKFK